MDGGLEVMCARHPKTPTRLTCVECETPICPQCAIRTPVGFKCPDHATRPPAPGRSRFGLVAVVVLVLALLGVSQLARRIGVSKPDTPPCPTQTAPDVGIGAQGGGPHWKEMAASGLCGRYDAASAWTGKELLIWGGQSCAGAQCPSDGAPHLADGAAYTPASNSWRRLPASPLTARQPAATVWTGKEMLVWGGTSPDGPVADGAAYDPARNRWRKLAGSPLAARDGAMSAWTGKEMVVWGGGDRADGAAYEPAADTWRPLAAGPLSSRAGGVAAWTGKEMVLWGGASVARNQELTDGAAYDPGSDKWRPIGASPLSARDDAAAVWTGRELVIWGGNTRASNVLADGAAYDPATDKWRSLPRAPISPRTGPAVAWSGTELVLWGGLGFAGSDGSTTASPFDRILDNQGAIAPLADGAAYDPASNTWRTLERVKLLARAFPLGAWDGQGMEIWGGLVAVAAPASAADGVRYTP